MNVVTAGPDSIELRLSKNEMLLFNNALNEVCNGVDIGDFEFEARLGVKRDMARDLLRQVGTVWRSSFKVTQ